ncbi:hypothetical protein JZX87_10945 [Agrobacterium sp. Ap1]|uniref:hypothetical protein n=1 Tax=Agrobacterium sp. Ap1 TaxID=2815337 RepID=UPI001A8FEC8F|nr:hypothetical protein [Agrobacterium sp. Ap1]MBO0141675.1 hypothetical protein [Agrobacterium sp. Ap1]
MSREKPPIDTRLAARTAEAMALPLMVCRHRNCRRGQRCRWFFKATNEPCCLRNLDPGQRAIFDFLYEDARFTREFLGWEGPFFEDQSGPQRMRDDLAIAIARNVANRYLAKRWDATRRAREKRMAVADRLAGAED